MQNKNLSFNKKVGVCALTTLLFVILINTTGCINNNADNNSFDINQSSEELSKENVKVGNDGVNAAIAPDNDVVVNNNRTQIDIEEDVKDISNTTMVTMSIVDTGRSDPFLPDNEKVVVKVKPKLSYDLLPPPEIISVDNTATEMISTKVSGIMYDKYNPSAILNISGSDYLVRSGDLVNGYKILSITKDTVTVQNGKNIYKAGVGEMFTTNSINFNTISNLEGKFGGSKNKNNK